MKKIILISVGVICLSLVAVGQVFAQAISVETIVEKLAPKQPVKRSVLGSAGVKAADEEFLKRLPARGINIEEKAKYVAIVKESRLPSVDIPVQFEFDSAVITVGAYKQVQMLAAALNDPQLATGRYSLNGFTDAKGTAEHNQMLSETRAASVQDALIKEFNVDPRRLVVVGFGEDMLKDTADSEGAINRRVEVVRLGDL